LFRFAEDTSDYGTMSRFDEDRLGKGSLLSLCRMERKCDECWYDYH
jgi:hypothetical protein